MTAGNDPELPGPAPSANAAGEVLAATGRAFVAAGRWVGRSVAAGYRAIDPDLRQHLAQLPLVGLTLLVRPRPVPEPLPDDGRRPVVFVHGLGGAPGNFGPMQLYFRARGRTRSYAAVFAGAGTLPELAERLSGFLDEVVRVNGLAAGDRIDLVAHSMGGLVVRAALEHDRTRARVANLVTLGTPHAGSHLARYGYTTHSLALRPDSAALQRLARQLPWRGPPAQPRLVACWSAADVIVLPARSAAVEGAENVELAGLSHYGYLIHPAAWRVAFEALDGA